MSSASQKYVFGRDYSTKSGKDNSMGADINVLSEGFWCSRQNFTTFVNFLTVGQ
jgi:hypothetical protein